MRLATFEHLGQQYVGVVDGQQIVDVTSVAPSLVALVQGGAEALTAAKAAAAKGAKLALGQVCLVAPFPRPPKNILCLGVNYRAHGEEAARAGARPTAEPPKHPIWFTKAVTSVCGPHDDIELNLSLSQKYDWEAELAVVIGREGRHIPRDRALDYVHSYTVFNDFSVRDFQLDHGGQWFMGKSLDRASPMGPWLVTPDELGDAGKLRICCRINGVTKQDANTSELIFDVTSVIADISQILTLEPGDVISTGTPAGVALGRNPPEWLKPGDVMETEIERIGTLRNRMVASHR
jgi:2-keto-4-pentenoate hydratase/2-oxohepta-3-ene-1,7-dioic acid hydratase in catechol pathway